MDNNCICLHFRHLVRVLKRVVFRGAGLELLFLTPASLEHTETTAGVEI
jgi:hypothetical protein